LLPAGRQRLPLECWLPSMLSTGFFAPCEHHREHKKCEATYFCADCGLQPGPLCTHCLGDHVGHRVIQVSPDECGSVVCVDGTRHHSRHHSRHPLPLPPLSLHSHTYTPLPTHTHTHTHNMHDATCPLAGSHAHMTDSALCVLRRGSCVRHGTAHGRERRADIHHQPGKGHVPQPGANNFVLQLYKAAA
jgi:hypothetical protein